MQRIAQQHDRQPELTKGPSPWKSPVNRPPPSPPNMLPIPPPRFPAASPIFSSDLGSNIIHPARPAAPTPPAAFAAFPYLSPPPRASVFRKKPEIPRAFDIHSTHIIFGGIILVRWSGVPLYHEASASLCCTGAGVEACTARQMLPK